MGVLISRFRKKKSTIEVLEQIEKDIEKLQKFRLKNQQQQKRFIGKLVLYSIVIYVIAALVFFFYYLPEKWKDRLLYSIPLLVFPVVMFGIKKLLHWYFVKRIAGNDMALTELREQKKQILEDVMETETYKKAKEILEKFDPNRFKELEPPKQTPAKLSPPGTELRQRNVAQRSPQGAQPRPAVTPRMPMATPMRPQQQQPLGQGVTPYAPRAAAMGMQPRNLMSPQHNGYGTPQGPPLPRPILPRERGTMDRLLEYLVGDGPQNRYALICRSCFSHNGMALKEEFEFIDFRCCYCHTLNPARKKRPFAPRIEPPSPPKQPELTTQDDDIEDEDGEDNSDEETSSGEPDGGTVDRHEESMDTETAATKVTSRVPLSEVQNKDIPNIKMSEKPGSSPEKDAKCS